jgi:hypothetical protein
VFVIHFLKPIAKTIPPLWFLKTIGKPIGKISESFKNIVTPWDCE